MNINNAGKVAPINPKDLMRDPNFPKFDDDGMAFNDFQKAYIEKYVRTALVYFLNTVEKYKQYERRKNERLTAISEANMNRNQIEWEIPRTMKHHDPKSPAYIPEQVMPIPMPYDDMDSFGKDSDFDDII